MKEIIIQYSILLTSTDYDTAKLIIFLAGKFAITIAFTVVYVFTAELFPTELRHSMLGTCSMVGRIGSIIAPQTPLLVSNIILFFTLIKMLFCDVKMTADFLKQSSDDHALKVKLANLQLKYKYGNVLLSLHLK
jgi:hypothetical protein